MRPIYKGGVPVKNYGSIKTVSDYKQWRADLIDRIGFYCCYCNIPLKDSPQVEHVIAQDIDPTKALEWENMLLACGPCNRTKSAKSCPPVTHYLPQFHNTHLAFEYFVSPVRINNSQAAFVKSASIGCDISKSNNTIDLCGLDKDTTSDVQKATDLRWKYRNEAFVKAKIWRNEFDNWANSILDRFVVLLKTIVQETGFWSIWYKEFEDVLEIRKMLVNEIVGTDKGSFDLASFNPIPRIPLYPGDTI
jgi:hypothetical protein